MADSENRKAYWRANLKLTAISLAVWFAISYLAGIIFVEQLNAIHIGGYKLGFWFAQQGSMYGFVIIIFVYARRMAVIDRKFGVHE
jgi:putative solute:sodium symporter small subunit